MTRRWMLAALCVASLTAAIAGTAMTSLAADPADPHAAPHAAAPPSTGHVPAGHDAASPAPSTPVLPIHDAVWAGVAVIVIAALFLAAAAIGPIVRANMPDEPPPAADEHGHGDGHGGHGGH
jgi:hypothetical protein